MEINKKIGVLIAIIGCVLLFTLSGIACFLFSKYGMVKIKENRINNIKYENFDNGLISMKIPKGWVVQISENADLPHFTFMVYNPQNRNYQIFVNLKYEGFVKSQSAKNFFIRTYGYNHFASKMPVLSGLSTENYYKNTFNQVAKLNSTSNFIIPTMKNYTVIQNFGKTIYGGDLLRATYIDANGNKVEGVFTASPKDLGSYFVRENFIYGKNIDTYYRNVYNTMFVTTPDGEFVYWEKILADCLNSIKYSDKFVAGVKSAQDNVMKNLQSNSQAYNKISDMVMSSWEKRNKSYDIISQKRSDATLGYERVYNTENGKIYKAYNGFTDKYKGKKYQPITDDMYTKPINGYIEK